MKRLTSTVAWDAKLQLRNGFYYAAAVVALAFLVVLSYLPRPYMAWLLPPVIFTNLQIGTFYFLAGLVLLEKRERTLEAQVVTPLRPWEYLASKTLTLTALAIVENLSVTVLVYGLDFNLGFCLLGTVAAAVLYALFGLAMVVRYDSINEFLMPSFLFTLALSAPLVDYFGLWKSWIIYLHPLQPSLVLLRAGFHPASAWEIVYGVAYSLLSVGLLCHWSARCFRRFVVAREGER